MSAALTNMVVVASMFALASARSSDAAESWATLALLLAILATALGLWPGRNDAGVVRALRLLGGSVGVIIALAILAQVTMILGRAFRLGGPSLRL